jgi:hypothetical protein
MRVASGALVCGTSVACGSHGAGVSSVAAVLRVPAEVVPDRSCLGFSVLDLALTRLSDVCFRGLRVRRISTSRSLTSLLSTRRPPDSAVVDCLRACDVVELRFSFSPLMSADATRGRVEDE